MLITASSKLDVDKFINPQLPDKTRF